ncbi:MAG: TIGR04283 family arsenosugar biosynthesis glycosyltransferase [Thermodesulfobacteriota bacterium]
MRPPAISVIIPVYNECAYIRSTLDYICEMPSAVKREMIVSDGHPLGTTLACIHRENVLKVLSPRGRAVQMNTGAALASGDILLFLHADTLPPPDAFQCILSACRDSRIAGGAFHLGIRSRRRIYRIIEGAASRRSRLTRIPYGDQAIFMRARIFREIGGYAALPIMEDIELMKRIKKAGKRIVILPSRVQTSPRRWETEGPLFCTLRNWALAGLYAAGVHPRHLAKFYR